LSKLPLLTNNKIQPISVVNISEFDRRFDDGESIIEVLDITAARHQRQEQKCVNVDLPLMMVDQFDQEANRLGVTRQSIIKAWLAERLERPKSIGVQ
jgi:c-di-AMP phosphodiesterase-like protein